ncbi:MAG: glycosyltransferase family 4 protein [Sedimentisphaerales bacterium]|nr:glycosyltransferase family 4 protein [Sedimentisphaerales bacterium]
MKIVHIITRLILGGAQENTLLTCEGLRARGHKVTLITGPALGPEGQLLDRARAGGYRVIEVDGLRRAINPLRDIPVYSKLKKLLREFDPDIVHTHSAKAGILGRRAAWKLRTATDNCCSTCARVDRVRQEKHGRPKIVHTIHGLAFHPYQNALLNRCYIACERTAARQTDAFISVAQAMTDQALAAGIGRPEQYTCIFSGMETDTYLQPRTPEQNEAIRREFNLPANAVVIVTIARLFALKGHEYIIEAARNIAEHFPRAHWLFVGDGSWRQRIQQQIDNAGLSDRFHLTGLVPPQRIPDILHACDILVHCSLREGLARALPQALLCEKPVISFDVDGAREVVIDDQTGFLIPPRDVKALIDAQAKLITNSDLRRRLGQTGRKQCQESFNHHTMVNQIELLYHNLI